MLERQVWRVFPVNPGDCPVKHRKLKHLRHGACEGFLAGPNLGSLAGSVPINALSAANVHLDKKSPIRGRDGRFTA